MCSFALFILALSADPDGSGPSVGGPPSSKERKGDNTRQGYYELYTECAKCYG